METGLAGGTPFDAYPMGGREPLGIPREGDGTARRGYGREVLRLCGYRCAYCGLDMATFEGWLQLSVDHVVPQQMIKAGWRREWVLDTFNVVACCGACNGLFNRDPATGELPATLDEFLAIRDAMFSARRGRIRDRRAAERLWFEREVLAAAKAGER